MQWDIWGLIAWILLALVAGVIGNAAWDLVKPRAHDGVSWAFRLITLNQKRFRDDIYVSAAARHRHAAGFYFSIAWIAIALGVLSGYFLIVTLTAFGLDVDVRGRSIAEYLGWPKSIIVSGSIFSTLMFGVALVFLLRKLLAHVRIEFTIASFEQALAQLGPALASSDEKSLRQDFARMQGEEDYSELWLRIRAISAAVGEPLSM